MINAFYLVLRDVFDLGVGYALILSNLNIKEKIAKNFLLRMQIVKHNDEEHGRKEESKNIIINLKNSKYIFIK